MNSLIISLMFPSVTVAYSLVKIRYRLFKHTARRCYNVFTMSLANN